MLASEQFPVIVLDSGESGERIVNISSAQFMVNVANSSSQIDNLLGSMMTKQAAFAGAANGNTVQPSSGDMVKIWTHWLQVKSLLNVSGQTHPFVRLLVDSNGAALSSAMKRMRDDLVTASAKLDSAIERIQPVPDILGSVRRDEEMLKSLIEQSRGVVDDVRRGIVNTRGERVVQWDLSDVRQSLRSVAQDISTAVADAKSSAGVVQSSVHKSERVVLYAFIAVVAMALIGLGVHSLFRSVAARARCENAAFLDRRVDTMVSVLEACYNMKLPPSDVFPMFERLRVQDFDADDDVTKNLHVLMLKATSGKIA